jgi:non-heme chloroperoxidase
MSSRVAARFIGARPWWKCAARTVLALAVGVPLLCLLVAVVLVLLPFEREQPVPTLDFRGLSANQKAVADWQEAPYLGDAGARLFARKLQGNGRAMLILLHGSGSEGRYLMPLAVALREEIGATVVVPDLRGHGRSGERRGDVDYVGQLENDLAQLVKQLRQLHPERRLILAGHSSGGGLVLRYAGNGAMPPVDAYLLLAPYLGYDAPTVRPRSGGWVQVALARYVGLTMLNRARVTGFNDLPVLYFNRPADWNDELQAGSYSWRLNESLSPRPGLRDLNSLDKPTLVLVGERDDAFYPEKFSAVFAEQSAAKVAVIPDVDHLGLPASPAAQHLAARWIAEAGFPPR